MSLHSKPSNRLGVCSWSLQPHSIAELVERVSACGVRHVQLALAPLRTREFDSERTAAALSAAGIAIASGMSSMRGEDYSTLETIRHTGGVRLDEHWKDNLAAVKSDAANAHSLGISLVTFHAGFLPHERNDPERVKLTERLRTIVDVFADHGVRVGFETGQETADTLLEFLSDLDRASSGVNFDPANMILYGMGDPVAALEKLVHRVHQVHVKDARARKATGEWGTEVVVGTGDVNWARFCAVLVAQAPLIDWMIEREAGSNRVADIVAARTFVEAQTTVRA
ncbi:MAG: sugar phosphate isomerase/epimerase family protein [Planctomycetota bacterium]|nr:sugar phosphate isomerase/epimerase family protein [Planctomycetota bacterium]